MRWFEDGSGKTPVMMRRARGQVKCRDHENTDDERYSTI